MSSDGTDLPPQSIDVVRNGHIMIISMISFFLFVATAVVFARFYVRTFMLKALGLDELFIAIAWVRTYQNLPCNWADLVPQICSVVATVFLGLVAHDQIHSVADGAPTVPAFFIGLKWQTASLTPIILCATLTRMSFCCTLLRIMQDKRGWKIGLWVLFGFATVTGIGSSIFALLQCRPIKKYWTPAVSGSCWSLEIYLNLSDFVGDKL